MQKTIRKVLRVVADYDPDYYDMFADANEAFFAQLYLDPIVRHAEESGIRPPASLLEAGCQAGRLVVPLAQRGFDVTGIDTSGFALRRAREHAHAAGVKAVFLRGDLRKILREPRARRYDIVVCAEVLYLSPHYREMLRVLAEAVRPGGILCVSHRPRLYYLMEALKQGDIRSAAEVLRRAEGPFRDSAYYNWQTEDNLHELYRSLGLQWVTAYPIDQLAWLSGVSPAQLNEAGRVDLRQMEQELSTPLARYTLVVAARPADEKIRCLSS